MFVGHYNASFVAKSVEKSIPLWVLFVAAQLIDIGWASFIFSGVERVRIVPHKFIRCICHQRPVIKQWRLRRLLLT